MEQDKLPEKKFQIGEAIQEYWKQLEIQQEEQSGWEKFRREQADRKLILGRKRELRAMAAKKPKQEDKPVVPDDVVAGLFTDWDSISRRKPKLTYSIMDMNQGNAKLSFSCSRQSCGTCFFRNHKSGTCESSNDHEKILWKIIENAQLIIANTNLDWEALSENAKEIVAMSKVKMAEDAKRAKEYAKIYKAAVDKFNEWVGTNTFSARIALYIESDMERAAKSEEGFCLICSRSRYCTEKGSGKRSCDRFKYSYVKSFTSYETHNADIDVDEEGK